MRARSAPRSRAGHALFLTYAVLAGRERATRLSALLVLGQVAATKLTLLRDPETLVVGVVLGTVAAMVCWAAESDRVR